MLTTKEQMTILKLAKSLVRASVKNSSGAAKAARLGDPVYKLRQRVKVAEDNLMDYLKDVG